MLNYGYIFRLIFIPPYTQSLTISNLLWSIAVDDYILKLITIIFKIFVIMMPIRLLPIIKRVCQLFTILSLKIILYIYFDLGKSISVHWSYISIISMLCTYSTMVVLHVRIISGSKKSHWSFFVCRLYGVQRHWFNGLCETMVDSFIQITTECCKFI